LRVYPLSDVDAPLEMEFISLSEQAFNTIHANDVSFFDELDAVIQREPLGVIDDEIRGLLSSIGIRKGTPFAPDDRMRALLTEAVAVANGTARAIAFKTRDPEAYKYPNSQWKTAFIGDDYRWLVDDGVGGRNLDARTVFFYLATVNTPAMALHIPVWVRNTRTPSTTVEAITSTAAGTTPSPSHPESRPKNSGRSSSTTPRPDRSSRPGNRSRARTTRATRSLPTLTARSLSPSDRPSLTRNPATGSRPFPERSGSPSCGSTDR